MQLSWTEVDKVYNDKLKEAENAQEQPMVQKVDTGERVKYRDATGRIHGDLPEYPDPKMTKAELEDQANELRESIKARDVDNAQKGGDASPKGPTHRARIDEERFYLRQIENKLADMK